MSASAHINALWRGIDNLRNKKERFEALLVISDAYRDAEDDLRADTIAEIVKNGYCPEKLKVIGSAIRLDWWDIEEGKTREESAELYDAHVDSVIPIPINDLTNIGAYNSYSEAYIDLMEALVRVKLGANQPQT